MSSTTSANAFWNTLDGVVVVNLDERHDRWDQLQAEAAGLPGLGGLTRISAVRGTKLSDYGQKPWFRGRHTDPRWAARAGCTLSHRKALTHARQSGWKTLLVLEDDADLQPLRSLDMDRLADILFNKYSNWDVCYLGYSQAVGVACPVSPQQPDLLEVQGCYTTHAYLVKGRAIDWIIRQLPDEKHVWSWTSTHRIIDRWYARNLSRQLKVYAFAPALIHQRTTFSDIVNREVDYQVEFADHLPRITHRRLWFNLRKRLLNTLYSILEIYDAVRGLRKRLRGF